MNDKLKRLLQDDKAVRVFNETALVNIKQVADHQYDVYIGRENKKRGLEESMFKNPFKMSDGYTRHGAVIKYGQRVEMMMEADERFRRGVENLQGKILACYCVPELCHGDVLLHVAETGEVPALMK